MLDAAAEQSFEEGDVQSEGAREARDGAAGADGDAVADEDEVARRGAQCDEQLRLEDVLKCGRGVRSELWCAAKWGRSCGVRLTWAPSTTTTSTSRAATSGANLARAATVIPITAAFSSAASWSCEWRRACRRKGRG